MDFPSSRAARSTRFSRPPQARRRTPCCSSRATPRSADEDALKPRFGVVVLPSLVVTRGVETLAVISKIRDWTEYVERIGACLVEGAPALKPGAGPKTEIRHNGQRTSA